MILAVVGPTGTGKTRLALELASRLDAEIVNADSRQVYRGLDIGSAKPTAAARARVPHHLFDVVAPDESFDCARYRELARAAIEEIEGRGRTALLTGGTGLYLKVLRYGIFPGPPRDSELRRRLADREVKSPGALHARLREVDAEAARRLHPNDRARLMRALEVFELTGRPISAWQAEHAFGEELPMRVVGLAMDRVALYDRLNARCREMVEEGLVDEVRGLFERGYGPDLPAMRSIGYREIGAYLRAACGLDQAIDDMARATRRFAKRQLTWFRAQPDVRWIDAAAGADAVLRALGVPAI